MAEGEKRGSDLPDWATGFAVIPSIVDFPPPDLQLTTSSSTTSIPIARIVRTLCERYCPAPLCLLTLPRPPPPPLRRKNFGLPEPLRDEHTSSVRLDLAE